MGNINNYKEKLSVLRVQTQGMLPGRWGFGISTDSLVNWIDAFLCGAMAFGWCSVSLLELAYTLVGMFGSLDILLVGSSIALKKKKIYIYMYVCVYVYIYIYIRRTKQKIDTIRYKINIFPTSFDS